MRSSADHPHGYDTTPATRLADTWQHGRHAGLKAAELPPLAFDVGIPSLMHRVVHRDLRHAAPRDLTALDAAARGTAAHGIPALDEPGFVAAVLRAGGQP